MWAKFISFFMSIYVALCGFFGINVPETQPTDTVAAVELVENGSTGYQWQYEISDESVVEMTEKTVVEAPPAGLVGAASTVAYNFKGLKEGSTVVVFTYVRSWEKEYPAKVHTYLFTVDEELHISYSEIE